MKSSNTPLVEQAKTPVVIDRVKPARVNFDLDPSKHKRLKVYAATKGMTVAELLRDMIAAIDYSKMEL